MLQEMPVMSSGGGGGSFESRVEQAGTQVVFTGINNAYVTCDAFNNVTVFYSAYFENGALKTEFEKHNVMTATFSNGTLTLNCSYSQYGDLTYNIARF